MAKESVKAREVKKENTKLRNEKMVIQNAFEQYVETVKQLKLFPEQSPKTIKTLKRLENNHTRPIGSRVTVVFARKRQQHSAVLDSTRHEAD